MLAPAPRRLELCVEGSVADVVYGEDVVARPLVPTVGRLQIKAGRLAKSTVHYQMLALPVA